MFRGEAINELITLLERRGGSLYHACQYADFCGYLAIGGIPSRALLERSNQVFTSFVTDDHDRQNGVWDKVFVNLADFGELFARGLQVVPNPYGPIVLQIRPSALVEADDVAVCLRSAGAAGFNREWEALHEIEMVEALFRYASDAGFPRSYYLKPIAQLQSLRPGARVPEVSCTIAQGILPLHYVIVIWTDPYIIAGRPLSDWIKDAINKAGLNLRLWERYCNEDRRGFYSELPDLLWQGSPSLYQISKNASCSPGLQAWADTVLTRGLEYQFQRYQRYLVEGTLQPLAGG